MPLFTASARARWDDGCVDVVQMVVASYDRDHAFILLTDATLRHNHRTRKRQKLPMFELIAPALSSGRRAACSLQRALGSSTFTAATSTESTPTPVCTGTPTTGRNEHDARRAAVAQ